MNYYAVDRWSSGDSLAHYKYIKKIKIGPFTRYFYSMKDLQNYYNTANAADIKDSNKKYGSDASYKAAKYAYKTAKPTIDTFGSAEDKAKYAKLGRALDAAHNFKKGWDHGRKIGNVIETGRYYATHMFGSSSKNKLKMQEIHNYKKNRRKIRKASSSWRNYWNDAINSLT